MIPLNTTPERVRIIQEIMREVPVFYMIFDVIYLDGRLLLKEPYTDRRRRLGHADQQPAVRQVGRHPGPVRADAGEVSAGRHRPEAGRFGCADRRRPDHRPVWPGLHEVL